MDWTSSFWFPYYASGEKKSFLARKKENPHLGDFAHFVHGQGEGGQQRK
jgi:hypothetical protein